jgi:hypothetical protein
MSNLQAPRPGGMGGPTGPRGPGGPSGSVGSGPGPGAPFGGGPKPPQPKVKAPSDRALLFVFLIIVVFAIISVILTPNPFSHPSITATSVIGGLLGLFGCTITFGFYRFMVNQQYAANSFSEWNFPVSRGRMAQVATIVGWTAGAVNCYLISYEVARNFVDGVS